MLEEIRRRAHEFEVLHFHIDLLHFPLIRDFADRTLTTLHGRLDLAVLKPFYRAFELRRPELFCGLPRRRARNPTFYPVACSPQAWAAATPLSLLQSCLGLEFDPNALQISLNEPRLPSFLDEVTLRHLLIGNGSADIAIRRSGRNVVVDVIDRKGNISVLATA